jgi:hypothetical protein
MSRALRRPGVRFSTTLAQNQPEALLGDGLQFDLSAVKEESRGRFSGHFIIPKITWMFLRTALRVQGFSAY